MLGQVLCRVDGTVLAARTAEADGQVGEATLHISFHRSVDQAVDMLQEGGDFAVVLQEADDGFVQSGEGLVAFVLAGIVHGPAVEDEAAAVARRIFRDAFLVGKAGDLDYEAALLQVVGKLFQLGQLGQYLAQIRIFGIGLAEQLAQVLDGEGHTLNEVGLLLEIAAETVGTQYLHGAEQHEVAELGHEVGLVHGLVLAQGVDVLVQQFLAEAVGIVGLGLPQERSHVVVDGTFAPALKVDEPRFTVLDHDVAALEVAVHERGRTAAQQYVGHLLEVVLEAVLLEVESGGFEEAILEVVQVPQDAAAVELGLRIAVGEVHAFGSGKLDGGQQAERLAQ